MSRAGGFEPDLCSVGTSVVSRYGRPGLIHEREADGSETTTRLMFVCAVCVCVCLCLRNSWEECATVSVGSRHLLGLHESIVLYGTLGISPGTSSMCVLYV